MYNSLLRQTYIIFLLAVLMISGCSMANNDKKDAEEDKRDEEIVGDDWRTYRGYSYGSISEAEDISVLFFCFDNGVVEFYLDDRVQMPVLTVDMKGVENPNEVLDNAVFSDLNADGYNDLSLQFSASDLRQWLWMPEVPCFEEANNID